MQSFQNFAEAHDALKITSNPKELVSADATGITSLLIIYNSKSLNEANEDWSILHYVGKGKQKISGYPTLNQNELEQMPFYHSKLNANPFPVLFKAYNKRVYLLGQYTVLDIKKIMGWSGFTYFRVTLLKNINQ